MQRWPWRSIGPSPDYYVSPTCINTWRVGDGVRSNFVNINIRPSMAHSFHHFSYLHFSEEYWPLSSLSGNATLYLYLLLVGKSSVVVVVWHYCHITKHKHLQQQLLSGKRQLYLVLRWYWVSTLSPGPFLREQKRRAVGHLSIFPAPFILHSFHTFNSSLVKNTGLSPSLACHYI